MLAFGLALVPAVPFLILVHLLAGHSIRREEDAARNLTLAMARLGAYAADEHARGVIHYVEVYSRRLVLRAAWRKRDPEAAAALLREMARHDDRVAQSYAVDVSGTIWAGQLAGPLPAALSTEHGFPWLRDRRATHVSSSLPRPGPSGEWIIAVTAPVTDGDDGPALGLLVAEVSVKSLGDSLARAVGTWNGSWLLLDREGSIAIDPARPDRAHRARPGWAADLEDVCRVVPGPDGHPWFTAAVPVPSLSGRFIARRSVAASLAGERELASELYLVTGALALLIAGAVHLLLERRQRRMDALRREGGQQRELHQRKTDYVTYVAHELQAPLEGMQGYVDVLRRGLEQSARPWTLECLHLLEERIGTLTGVVGDLLDVSKIEAARVEVRPEEFDLEPIARRLLDGLKHTALERGLRTSLACEGAGTRVRADRRHVEQLLTLLVSRALRHTVAGEIGIAIRGGPSTCEVEVRDDGPGLTREQRARALERFAPRALEAGEDHAGPELYLCRLLVELQGGAFRVESGLSWGTRVQLTLPRAAEAAAVPVTSAVA